MSEWRQISANWRQSSFRLLAVPTRGTQLSGDRFCECGPSELQVSTYTAPARSFSPSVAALKCNAAICLLSHHIDLNQTDNCFKIPLLRLIHWKTTEPKNNQRKTQQPWEWQKMKKSMTSNGQNSIHLLSTTNPSWQRQGPTWKSPAYRRADKSCFPNIVHNFSASLLWQCLEHQSEWVHVRTQHENVCKIPSMWVGVLMKKLKE